MVGATPPGSVALGARDVAQSVPQLVGGLLGGNLREAGGGALGTGLGLLGMVPLVGGITRSARGAALARARRLREPDITVHDTPETPPRPPGGPTDAELAVGYRDPENPNAVIEPRYQGAAPDRSEGNIARYAPAARNVSQRLEDSITALRENRGGVMDQMEADVRRGMRIGGQDWYNAEELRDWFVASHHGDAAAGHAAWREFIELIGAASTGSNVRSNIRNASYYFNRGRDWIRRNADQLEAGEMNPPQGFGHKMQRNHQLNAARADLPDPTANAPRESAWAARRENPNPRAGETMNEKPLGFVASLLGNQRNIAADLHFTRYFGLATRDPRWLDTTADISDGLAARLREQYGRGAARFLGSREADGKAIATLKPRDFVGAGRTQADRTARMDLMVAEPTVWTGMPTTAEYGRMEEFAAELARKYDLTPAQFQAALWMGGADRTGLADQSRGTLMDLMRKQIEQRAGERGVPPAQVWDDFVNRRPGGTLLIPGLLGGGAAAAAAAYGGEEPRQ